MSDRRYPTRRTDNLILRGKFGSSAARRRMVGSDKPISLHASSTESTIGSLVMVDSLVIGISGSRVSPRRTGSFSRHSVVQRLRHVFTVAWAVPPLLYRSQRIDNRRESARCVTLRQAGQLRAINIYAKHAAPSGSEQPWRRTACAERGSPMSGGPLNKIPARGIGGACSLRARTCSTTRHQPGESVEMS